MSLFDGFRAWLRGDDLNARYDRMNAPVMQYREAAGSQIVRWERNQPAWIDKDVRSFDKDAFRKISLIFACVQYMSNAAGAAPVKVFRALNNGQEEEVPDHPFRMLMQNPNPAMGESRFISFVTMVATIAGFCVIEKERDQVGNVIGLWPLRADWIRPIPRGGGEVDWEYRVPGYAEPFIIEHRDAIPVTYADLPTSDPTGIGPIETIFQDAQISADLNDFVKSFLEGGAMPMYMAIPDTEGPLAAEWKKPGFTDAFREKFTQTYTGINRSSNVMISPWIKDIKPLGFNINELAYMDLRDVSEAAICTAFGIPPILVGARVGLERATYNNTTEMRKAFHEDKMVYWWARFDDAVTRHLVPEFWPNEDIDVRFDVSGVSALQEDENQSHERARNDFTAGLVSRHVAQRLAGIDPHGTDSFLIPFSAVEVPNTGGERSTVTATLERLDERTAIMAASPTSEQRAAAERIGQANKQQIIRLAEQAEPILTRFFREQAGRIVEVAVAERDGSPVIEKRAIEQIDWDAEDEALNDELRQWWGSVSEVAFADVSALAGVTVDWNLSNPHLADLFDILGDRIQEINATTRQAVETVVRESLIDGTTIPDLAESLRDVVEETYRGRAESIARTESQLGYNTSSQRAYRASGVVSMVQMHDGTTCESGPGSDGLTCPQRNGMIVRVDDMERHISAEHPRGTLAFSPIVDPLGGE